MIQSTRTGRAGALVSSMIAFFVFSFIGLSSAFAQAPAPAAPQAMQPLTPRTPITGDVFVTPQGNDAGNGSQQHPWATITHASKMIGPGATVHVAPGHYNEAVVTLVSGTSSARIKYVSEKRWEAVIAPSEGGVFVWKNTGDYTDIVNFEIAGTSCNGIGLGGSYQRAAGNNVHNAADDCNGAHGGSGINDYEYETRDNEILGNYVHDVGIGDALCAQTAHRSIQGIYQSNSGGRISNNIAARNCVFGIHLWHAATHATITNNTVVYNLGGGILVGSGDSPCNTTNCLNDNTTVRNNIVAFNGNPVLKGWGIVEGGGGGGKMGTHNQYSHNLSYQNVGGDFAFENHLVCQNCIVGKDPELANPRGDNFNVGRSSPAVAHGTTADAPSTDYVGKQRTSADIGAVNGSGPR
jgi:hypothetical protein